MGFFERLKDGLSKTRKNFTEKIETLVGLSTEVDEDFLEEVFVSIMLNHNAKWQNFTLQYENNLEHFNVQKL